MENLRVLVVSIILCATFLLNSVEESCAAKILSISFVSSKSHTITYKPLLHALADRGHEVTIVSPIKGDSRKNVQHYQIPELEAVMQGAVANMFEVKEQFSSEIYTYLNNPFVRVLPKFEQCCRTGYASPIFQKIRQEKFDLVIFTPLFNDCLYGFIHELNTTTILFSQISILPWVAESFGAPTLPSFTPLAYYGFTDDMTFAERVINFLGIMYYQLGRKLYYIPRMEQIYREHLGPNVPSVAEIEGNASLVLVNSHINLVPPRPLLPDIIEVGGLQIQDTKPLPKDLQEFCDGAEHGVIYFSMGSFLQGSSMPEKYRLAFVKTFARLKQRVLWKWETETMPGLPPNVKLSKWLPQQDVLAHPKVRLFITHGGQGGTTEALWNGVPLLGIPMFGDQLWNMKQATKKGFALTVQLVDITEEKLYETIMRLLNEPSFQEKAKFLSRIYRDSDVKPLDRAVYWVEYVLRYGGAPHLRSAGRKLNFFQYFSLDVMLFLGTILVLICTVNVLILRAIVRKIFWKKLAPARDERAKKKLQ